MLKKQGVTMYNEIVLQRLLIIMADFYSKIQLNTCLMSDGKDTIIWN